MASKNAHPRRALHLTIMPGHVRPNHAYKALANSPRAPLASSGGGAHAVARGCGAVGAVAKGCGAVNANAVGGGGSVASGCGVVRAVARVGGAFFLQVGVALAALLQRGTCVWQLWRLFVREAEL